MRRLVLAVSIFSLACAPSSDDGGETGSTSDEGEGSTDGGTSTSDSAGDGDSTGDGDGDGTTSGDGDGTTSGDGDGTTSGDGDGDGNGCGLVLDCIGACAPDDTACQDGCIADGSTNGSAEAQALMACGEANMCSDEACLSANCTDAYLACATGPLTCSELSDCSDACTGDPTCEANCSNEANALAQGQFGAILVCALTFGCGDEACLLANCGPEIGECFSGTTDTLECPALIGCTEECMDEPFCLAQCASVGSVTGQTEASALGTCAEANGCTDDVCVETQCASELSDCFTGTGNCSDGWGCVVACADGPTCGSNCLAVMDPMAAGLLGDLADCAEANACADQACIDANCNSEQVACFAP